MHRLFRFLALLMAVPIWPCVAHASWIEAQSSNFIVYSEGGEADLRTTAVRLEEYHRLLCSLTGTPEPQAVSPLKVYLVASRDALQQVRAVPPSVAGFYTANVGGTAVFAVRGDRPGLDGEEVLFHEYAHHFMARYHPARYPAWYREGFAEYLMTARFRDDVIEVGRFNPQRAITLLRGRWLPVHRLLSGEPRGLDAVETAQYYAESWVMVHYIFSAPEKSAGLTRYLADLHRGVPEPKAFQAAFHQDHAAFEQELKRYMSGQLAYSVLAREQTRAPDVAVRQLSPAVDDLLLVHASMMLGIADPKREQEALGKVRSAAARFPKDAFGLKVLARAEINSGDRAAGVDLVDRLLARSENDPELFYLRGIGDFYTGRTDETVRTARFAAARPWFARAVAADPGYYTALYRLFQTSAPQADVSSGTGADNLSYVLRAHRLAPLVSDIAIDAAKAAIAHGRSKEAVNILLPILTNPHAASNDTARLLLDHARLQGRP